MAAVTLQYILVLVNAVILVLGGTTALICFRSFKRHSSFSMLCLTMGFGLIVAASVTGASLLSFSTFGFLEIQTVESALIAVGLAYVVHSIFTQRT